VAKPPKKKNNHYVPQSYLRRFRSVSDRQVGLFNLKSEHHVETAPIKSQCSKDYFYTKNPLFEDEFSKLEARQAPFDGKDDMASSLPSVASSVAACVIRFGAADSPDRDWAWEILARTEAMPDNPETFGGSIIPWHPKRRLVVALFNDRRCETPHADSVERLLKLTLHR
jgi:hypothetical protein